MKSTLNRSRESKWKDVSYSDEETTSRTENKAVEFTRKELQSLNQSKIKRELEKKTAEMKDLCTKGCAFYNWANSRTRS